MSPLISYILGIVTGALATYFGNRYTDMWRKLEARIHARKQFREIMKKMPELIAEMKEDLNKEEFQFIRDFFLLSRKWAFNTNKKYLYYYFEDHEDLQDKIIILENQGYVIDVTTGNTNKYRMTEEFVKMVLKL